MNYMFNSYISNKLHVIGYISSIDIQLYGRAVPRPSTASGLGVCEWSPEGLHYKSVSLILNTDEMLKLVKKNMN